MGSFKVIGQVGLGLIVGVTLYASDDSVDPGESFYFRKWEW